MLKLINATFTKFIGRNELEFSLIPLPPNQEQQQKEQQHVKKRFTISPITFKDRSTTPTEYNPLQMTFAQSTSSIITAKFQHIKQTEDERLHDATVLKDKSLWSVYEGVKAFELDRNRYANILPFDKNRVLLQNSTNDYINASFINLPNSSFNYIATQGPTKKTLGHFWQMVLQEAGPARKDVVVLMLTPLVENDVRKCSLYWCNSKDEFAIFNKEKFGLDYDLRLFCDDFVDDYKGIDGLRYTKLKLRKENDSSDEETTVHHLYFDKWADFDKPTDWKTVYNLTEVAREMNVDNRSLVTHCSAGVGRTGTFITLDYLLHLKTPQTLLELGQETDLVFETVSLLREQRMMMVQSPSQYKFLYDALGEYAVNCA